MMKMPYHDSRYVRSGVMIANVGLVVSSGVQRRVSADIRTSSTVNALQMLSTAQLTQQQGRTGRTDEQNISL